MVSIVGAQGSTPREAGARMLVWPDRFTGTIGGGSLERQAPDQARRLLAQTARRHALQDYPLGPMLGQCCCERRDVHALGRVGHADNASPMGPQKRMEIEIAGVVHQHGVAGLQQKPAEQIQRLRTRIGEDDLLGRRLPNNGLRVSVPMPSPCRDRGREISNAGKHTPTHTPIGKLLEPPLEQGQSRTRRRREVHDEAGMGQQPAVDGRRLVG